jgi:hypothetical protein
LKRDERILGDGEFAQSVLNEARERLEERFSVSISVKRGEKIVKDKQLEL